MTKSRLPLSPVPLALSLAVHAGALAGVLVWGGGYGDVAPRPGDGGPATLWISLLREAPSQGPFGTPAPEGAVPAARPAPAPAAPEASRGVLVARAPTPVPPAMARVAEPAIEAGPARETTVAAETSGAQTSPVSPPTGPAPRGGPGAGAARARDASSAGPDWPGPGEVDRVARPLWPIRPEYPPRARRRGEESTVVVEAWVDEAGAVAFASVLRSGGSDFDRSAQRAVRRSAFRPARLAGQDVASRVALRIHFQLYD